MLQIKRTSNLGSGILNWKSLHEPNMVLNFHYPDSVFFAMLAYIKKPKNILDLGSFGGMLPFITEDIMKVGNCDEKYNWILVDDCRYTKELYNAIKENGTVTGLYLKSKHLESWKKSNLETWKVNVFDEHGNYCLPPTSPDKFRSYWNKFADYYKISVPSMSMFNTLEQIPIDTKFDLVHFDLAAGWYEENLQVLELLLNCYMDESGIIVFDDIMPKHPKMIMLFLNLLENTDYVPVAFSTGKIAVIKKQHKEYFTEVLVHEADLVDAGLPYLETKNEFFKFYKEPSNRWGTYLNIRAN